MSLTVEIYKDLGSFILDVNFSVERETLALLGGSGCGKSMTLRCIAGIIKPDRGHIELDGTVLFDSEKHIDLPPQKRHVGLLFQNYALFPNMTVEKNIMCGMPDGLDRAEKRRRATEMMERLYLGGLGKRRPSQLSGGQQQRVALARILVSEPGILMLDEPFSALDSYLRWELEQETLKVIEEFNGPALLVSHNRDEVFRLSNRVAVYQDGKIVEMGEKHALFSEPHTYAGALLGGCKNISTAVWENGIAASQWGITLQADCPEDREIHYVGIRAQDLEFAETVGQNVFSCEIVREIEDVSGMILMLRPLEGPADAQIRWELSHEQWQEMQGKPLLVRMPEEKLLLLSETVL